MKFTDIKGEKPYGASQYARSLIEASLDPLVTISPEGKITDVNEATVKVTGVSRENLIGTDFSNYFTEPIKAREGYERVFKEGSVRDYPLSIRHSSDQITDVLYNASVYKDDKGNVLGVFAAARDITETKKVEKLLAELTDATAKKQLERTDATAKTQLEFTDATAKTQLEFTDATAKKQLERTDATAKTQLELTDATAKQQLERTDATAKKQLERTDATAKKQLERTDATAKTQLEFTDATAKTQLEFTDATAKKQLERTDATAKQQLEFTDATALSEKLKGVAKDEFSTMITHELNTPLVPILVYCKMFKTSMLGKINEEQAKAIKIIEKNAKRLETLITDIMDVRKLDLDQLKFNIDDLSLDKFFSNIDSDYREVLENKQCQFTTNLHAKNIVIKTDKTRLRQVFDNLIGNAIKFVPENKGKIKVGSMKENDTIVFYVKDNGIGILQEKQKNLFQKFYQIDTSERRSVGGTGLGLAISKGIVEKLGGTISVQSDGKTGTTFFIRLPSNVIV